MQLLDIYFVEGAVYKLLQGTMLALMKRQVPAESWNSSFVTFDGIDNFRKELDLKNRLVWNISVYAFFSDTHVLTHDFQVGYVFLVDQAGRIRWKGVGYAQHHEMKSLLECAVQLTRLR